MNNRSLQQSSFVKDYRSRNNLDPEKYANNPQYNEYIEFCLNGFWIGGYKDGELYEDKGLFIFAKKDINLKNNSWNSKQEFFLSVKVNDSLDIVGVWTQPKYVEQVIPWDI